MKRIDPNVGQRRQLSLLTIFAVLVIGVAGWALLRALNTHTGAYAVVILDAQHRVIGSGQIRLVADHAPPAGRIDITHGQPMADFLPAAFPDLTGINFDAVACTNDGQTCELTLKPVLPDQSTVLILEIRTWTGTHATGRLARCNATGGDRTRYPGSITLDQDP
jgi:hypothetical protein